MSSTNRGGERRKNDSYYTNPDLADFLVRLLVEDEWLDPDAPCRVLEPHAGKGAWIRAIRRHVPRAIITANDLVGDVSRWFECGADHASVGDFLELDDESFDAIIGNPPYSGAEEHVRHALTLSRGIVAFLLRLGFLETIERIALTMPASSPIGAVDEEAAGTPPDRRGPLLRRAVNSGGAL